MEGAFRSISKITGKDITGTYAETWVSGVKWRRDIVTASFHGIEIGSAPNKYSWTSGTSRPDPSMYGRLTMQFPNIAPEIRGVSVREVAGVKVSCAESKEFGSRNLDCVDATSGVLLMREVRFGGVVRETCTYRDYQKFREFLFPRSMRCVNAPGEDVELTISKLLVEPSPDENLFTNPPGSIETANCRGRLTAPKLTDDPEPKYPEHHQENQMVAISVVIGAGGKPQDLRVSNSGGNDFDQSALDAIRHWKFKPAICDGTPVAAEINVLVHFRKY